MFLRLIKKYIGIIPYTSSEAKSEMETAKEKSITNSRKDADRFIRRFFRVLRRTIQESNAEETSGVEVSFVRIKGERGFSIVVDTLVQYEDLLYCDLEYIKSQIEAAGYSVKLEIEIENNVDIKTNTEYPYWITKGFFKINW